MPGIALAYRVKGTVLVAQMVKNLPEWRRPWVRKIPWRREWQPTPGFLPGESYGQRSLVGYSPRGNKESDTTKQLTLSLYRVMSAHPLTMGDTITKVRIIIGKAQDY